jgi:predicted nucleotidyltransferase
MARDDQRSGSLTDVLSALRSESGSPAVMEIEEMLTARLGRPVQIISRRGLRSRQHASILHEMVEVF